MFGTFRDRIEISSTLPKICSGFQKTATWCFAYF